MDRRKYDTLVYNILLYNKQKYFLHFVKMRVHKIYSEIYLKITLVFKFIFDFH